MKKNGGAKNLQVLKHFLLKPYITAIPLALSFALLNYVVVYFPQLSAEEKWLAGSTAFRKGDADDSLKFSEAKDLKSKFLLIDVSNDQQVYCDSTRINESGLLFDSASRQSPCLNAPDLKKLTALFRWLADTGNVNKYGYIVCDLFVDRLDTVPETKELLSYIIQLQGDANHPDKILFANMYDYDKKEFVHSPFSEFIVDSVKGAVDVDADAALFLDYRLSYEGGKIRTLPLLMYERIDSVKTKKGPLDFYTYNDYSRQNNGLEKSGRGRNLFLPEMSITNDDIDNLKVPGDFPGNVAIDTNINRMELWQTLIKFDSGEGYYLTEALKTNVKKNIFIGSFNHRGEDMHNTVNGQMDGSTIILNIYLDLVHGKNKLSCLYILFVCAVFYVIALLLLYPLHIHYNGKFFVWKFIVNFITHYAQYGLLLLIIYGSNLWFHTITNALAMGILLSIADKYFSARRENRKMKEGIKKPIVSS